MKQNYSLPKNLSTTNRAETGLVRFLGTSQVEINAMRRSRYHVSHALARLFDQLCVDSIRKGSR